MSQESDQHDTSMSEESEQDEPSIDLKACSEIAYQQKGDIHGVSYVCDGEEGWTPVIGKGASIKSLHTCLDCELLHTFEQLRLLLTPAVTSDSSGSDYSLHIPPDADVVFSLCCGKPGFNVTTDSTSTWTPVASRTRSRLKS